ncbi:acetoacetyl-CoA synthetase [Povalibacter uvarum]|uniref:Acetoacetyl-CoA synthetase n=1 Tax=Povalibacter uvarum TaxID=732238 RepID=A0A841HKT6_9GAMM|nr:acetoacetate--CoA ligase [Povalibacter uvarum]MBB6093466.1 acetoacetyl-CoA synthetase [Povalibacter uvarum]
MTETTNHPQPLWRPDDVRIGRAGITRYRRWLKQRYRLEFADYDALWRWSVTEIEEFWRSVWEFGGVISHEPYTQVLDARRMPGAKWFQGATLNYAEHALRHAQLEGVRNDPAIIFQSEVHERSEVSWSQLASGVGALSTMLRRLGVQPGDRVAAYLPNIPETIVALLATASCGAVWSCASPDMGTTGVLDRFGQIEPTVLFAVDGYRYGGKDYDRRAVVADLVRQLPSLKAVIFVPYLNSAATLEIPRSDERGIVTVVSFAHATALRATTEFTPVPFDHPLWIVYSSGTTGMPKPIVHTHGGTVLETLKACALHTDVDSRDRMFWYTSTSWIMWNFVANTLLCGATVLLFDGNPSHPDLATLWRFAARERATFIGVSPAFIGMCMKADLRPAQQFDLRALRSVGATGSPLSAEGYRWVYEHVKADVMLAVISGGTDPGACFLTCCPVLPVYAGEMQCRELGVATFAYDDAGNEVMDEVGELVMTQPIPCMPIKFWNDHDGSRYYESYFDVYPGVWRHGDWLRLIPRPDAVTGVIYGRSDATINRHGIRMGTSEIYRVIEAAPEVADSLVVDLEYLGGESFLALFVVLRDASAADPRLAGAASASGVTDAQARGVSDDLRSQLFAAVRTQLSGRHVPNDVFAVPEVPRTLSGKKLEVPVRKILLDHPIEKAVNRSSMANAAALDWFVAFAAARRTALQARRTG